MSSASPPPGFTLLAAFENLFRGQVYLHRDSSLGNLVAAHLYEDLGAHSAKLAQRMAGPGFVVNVAGSTRGVKARRGDGTFGPVVPGSTPLPVPGFVVWRGMVALTQIGAEVKIVATAHLKQIDRVMKNLLNSASEIRTKSTNAITVGIAGVNYSPSWTGHEGTRQFPKNRKPASAKAEADEAARRLDEMARPAFDEFLLFRFAATNRPPYPFAWIDPAGTQANYGAALVRIAHLYDQRF